MDYVIDKKYIPKIDLLVSLFPEVGDKHPLDFVIKHTGIKNLTSLKIFLSSLRSGKGIPNTQIMDLRLKNGEIKRYDI
jgi:hypothetical protein